MDFAAVSFVIDRIGLCSEAHRCATYIDSIVEPSRTSKNIDGLCSVNRADSSWPGKVNRFASKIEPCTMKRQYDRGVETDLLDVLICFTHVFVYLSRGGMSDNAGPYK